MKKIKLRNSESLVLVSECDYNELVQHDWYIAGPGYVVATINKKVYRMHSYIMKPEKGFLVDHINGDILNNSRDNLRICTHGQNMINAIKKRGASVYKGVYYLKDPKRTKKWLASCQVNGKTISLGVHLTEEEAAIAYNKKVIEVWGEFAVINDIVNKTQIRYNKSTKEKE